MQRHFQTNGISIRTLVAGDRFGIWKTLHPGADTKFPQADDNAIVLLGQIFNHRVLLLSDLGLRGQNELLSRHPDLQADIIVTGLPRETEAVADGFLEVVNPRFIIVADTEQERASSHLRSRLAKRNIRVLYTSDSGAITLSFTSAGFTTKPSIHQMND